MRPAAGWATLLAKERMEGGWVLVQAGPVGHDHRWRATLGRMPKALVTRCEVANGAGVGSRKRARLMLGEGVRATGVRRRMMVPDGGMLAAKAVRCRLRVKRWFLITMSPASSPPLAA
jgi:hypothetical protein